MAEPRPWSCRRSRAGRAGSSPTGRLQLEAWEPAPADGTGFEAATCSSRRRARSSSCRSTAPPVTAGGRGRPVVLPLSVARERHPELVEPHLGTIVAKPTSSRRPTRRLGGRRFVWVPRGVRVEAPILLTAVTATPGTILHRRVLIVLEEGAEAEVWEQYVSGGDEATVLNTVVELKVGQNANLRYVCGQELNERSWIFGAQRAEVDATARSTGSRSASARRSGRVRMETLLAGPGADAKVTGASRRTRASTSTSTPRRSTARRTRRPTCVPRHPRRPLQRGLARDDQGRPARSRPTPSRSAATCCCPRRRMRTRSRGWRSSPTTSAARTRRRSRRSTASSLLPAFARARQGNGDAAGDRGLHGGAHRALRGGPDARGPRDGARTAPRARCWTDVRGGRSLAAALFAGFAAHFSD